MARHLDLEEQEQLAAVKAFWNQYGNAITWALIVVLGAFAAWNGWNWWQRDQAAKAAGVFEELDRAVDARDLASASGVFRTLQDRYGRTAFAQQGALLLARAQLEGGQADAARTTLAWVADNAVEDEYRTLARLRLAKPKSLIQWGFRKGVIAIHRRKQVPATPVSGRGRSTLRCRLDIE